MGNFLRLGRMNKNIFGVVSDTILRKKTFNWQQETNMYKESKKTFWEKIIWCLYRGSLPIFILLVFPLLKRRWALSWFLHHLGSDLNWKKGSEFCRNGILWKFPIIHTRWAPTNDEYRVITPLIGIISPVIYLSLYLFVRPFIDVRTPSITIVVAHLVVIL